MIREKDASILRFGGVQAVKLVQRNKKERRKKLFSEQTLKQRLKSNQLKIIQIFPKMETEVLDISIDDDETIIEPQEDDSSDYLFDKYLGRKRKNIATCYRNSTDFCERVDSLQNSSKIESVHREITESRIFGSEKILDIATDRVEIVKDPQSVPQKEDDLDYLFHKYMGDKKRKTTKLCHYEPTNNTTENFSLNVEKCGNHCNSDPIYTNAKESSSFSDDNLQSNLEVKKFKNLTGNQIFKSSEMNKTMCESNTEEQQKMEKERLLQEKLKMKEQKKNEDQRNKAIRDALANNYKNMKPENCMKFIKVQIAENLAKQDFLKSIEQELNKNSVSHTLIRHEVSSIVTWKIKLDTNIIDSNGQLIDASEGSEINKVLFILEWKDFLMHVHNKTFIVLIKDILTEFKAAKVILAILGLQKYYQYKKRNKNREFQENMSEKSSNNYRDQRMYANIPSVSRRTVEYILTEIQVFYSVSHKLVETEQDLASFVFQLTKAISQEPYKKQKREQQMQLKWFMPEANKNCIKIDKHGNGLLRLWKQMITKFPLASLETAEAIAAVYPTPLSLFEVYDKVLTKSEGEKLLQDIPIRRGAGPICTMRKIGPELSRKMYNFFTSVDPNTLL